MSDHKKEVKEKQSGMSYEDIKAIMASKNEFIFEMDNLKPQQHNWVDRGVRMSCENAGHPYHWATKG